MTAPIPANGADYALGVWSGPENNPARSVFEVIERQSPTLFFSVPSNYARLLAHTRVSGLEFDLSSVRWGVSAGEALPAVIFHRFQERFGVQILDAIGSTEALHMVIANRPGHVRPGSSGQVIPGFEARIVDDHNRELAAGEIFSRFSEQHAGPCHL